MRAQYFTGLIFSLFITYLGTAQEQVTPPRTQMVAWPFFQTVNKIDSLRIANPENYWSKQNQFGLDVNEVTYQNWESGGSNSISFLISAYFSRTYERESVRWKSELIAKYGLNAEKGHKLRKTDDELEFVSTFSYRTSPKSSWFYSAKVNFKTQFAKGYSYPDRDYSISSFMAPGRLFFGVGAELGKDSDTFTLYLSPSTVRTTFVLNQRLANQGAFGVDGAVFDDNDNIIRQGERSKTEFGFLLTNTYNTEIFENIGFSNRLSLYSDYINDFGNIDVDWRIEFDFRVNHFVTAKLGSHLRYYNDTKTTIREGLGVGEAVTTKAKVQWKQQIGIGVVFDI